MFDFAIIGSGVSGGRIAYELTRAGARCVLIEAGREYSARSFPREEIDSSTQLFWGGGLEVSADGTLGFLRAKVVGGTSIVNQALLDRFDDSAWDDWKQRSGIGFFSVSEMEAHYRAVEERIPISEIPKDFYNANTYKFIHGFEKKGYGWKPLHRAQGDCKLDQGSDCIVCLGGCPRDSKQSSLVTTIRWAREQGLELISEYEVSDIQGLGTRNLSVRGLHQGQPREIRAGQLVLAAGALGNTRILLESGLKKKLPALGKGFTCHPQFMTYALFDEPIDAHKGAFQAVKSEDRKLRDWGFKLENVFAPPIATAMLLPGMGREHTRMMKKFRYMASMEVAIRDEASGTIALGGPKLKIKKSLTSEDRKKAAHGLQIVRELFEAVNAKHIIQCPQSFGLHLMGGCALGGDPKTSVVDPEFQLHGIPGVYAADSSVFPSAPGINPSFTVMALSHRAAHSILKRGRG